LRFRWSTFKNQIKFGVAKKLGKDRESSLFVNAEGIGTLQIFKSVCILVKISAMSLQEQILMDIRTISSSSTIASNF